MRILLFPAVILLSQLCSCGPSTPSAGPNQKPATSKGEQSQAPARAAKPGAFRREQLLEDARQLADILESSHPDPYINGGGRIAFHRRLHLVLNAIPAEGMTRDDFYRLLRSAASIPTQSICWRWSNADAAMNHCYGSAESESRESLSWVGGAPCDA